MFRHPLLPAALVLISLLFVVTSPLQANPYPVNVCAGPAGGPAYDAWVSLPNRSWIGTAEELCLALGPSATSVFQLYPDPGATGLPPVAYQYTCPVGATPGVCAALGASPAPPEPGCATSSCFCLDDGEGLAVAVSAPVAGVIVDGCYTAFVTPVLGAATNYLASIAPDTAMATLDDLAIATNLTRTGLSRGTVTRINCATGAVTVVQGGTAQAMAAALVPGEGYRLRNPTVGFSYANPIAAAACACTETAFYDITGTGDGTDYAWWIDDGKNGVLGAAEVFDAVVAGEPVAAVAGDLAQNLVDSINLAFGGAPCSAALVSFSPARISITCTPCSFDLYVAPAAAGAPPFAGQCPVVSTSCTYNPTIRKVFPQQDAGDVEATLLVEPAAGGDLTLTWDASCLAGDTDYAVYEGTVGDWDSHASVQCSTAGATTTTLTPQAADSYYLVVPRNPLFEGSYGRDSAGIMRPQAAAACAVQQAAAACP